MQGGARGREGVQGGARAGAARLQLAHPALDGLPRAQLRLLRALLLLELACTSPLLLALLAELPPEQTSPELFQTVLASAGVN